MALIPVFASLLYYGNFGWALFVFFFAGLSDGLDGFIARRFHQESSLGTIIDPIADKLLMTVSFLMLTLPHVMPSGNHLPVPFWVTAAVIGRDVLILVVAAAIFVMTGFRGFTPSWLGKASTFVQVFAVGIIMISVFTPDLRGYYLPTTYVLVALFALLSGIHYIFHVARLMGDEKPVEQT